MFKELTPANWRQPDPTSTQFSRDSVALGTPIQMDGDDWARMFLAVELKPHVPQEVRDLFCAARGAALYGWFFYPLFRLGEEQLRRVVEAAAKACYCQLGGPPRDPSFKEVIEWLTARNVIPEADADRWEAARRLRNAASHPSGQSVMTPGVVLAMFKAGAHDINRLFARAQPRAPAAHDPTAP